MEDLLKRIEIDPARCHGKPVVRGTRVMVESVLEYLAGGDSFGDVAEELGIKVDDVWACVAYAAEKVKWKY